MASTATRKSLLQMSKSIFPQLSARRLAPYSSQASSPTGGASTPPKSGSAPQPQPSSSDNKSYQVPEYYGHNEMTFYDYEVKMRKARLPQPSATQKGSQ